MGDGFPNVTPLVAGIIRRFPFQYNTANLLTGASLYVPTVSDILLDAWIEILTAWNGTTPTADVGDFAGGTTAGWFGVSGTLPNMTSQDQVLRLNDLYNGGGAASMSLNQRSVGHVGRITAGRFTGTLPIKVIVTQTGLVGGADPVATQGTANLFLITATVP